mgnify:CR=1 FL=1|tara:strand:- start:897 stop:1724 length:828 start_codon:yes stop_codon:yes gene_type:complete
MKIKHNKKRNTAFIYESLVKEATASIIKNDAPRRKKAFRILNKHFAEGSLLRSHLDCYRSLYETNSIDKHTAEKILKEAKLSARLVDPQALFKKQTELIKDVNEEYTSDFYNTFVPNYRTLATIAQIFSGKLSPKNSIILESHLIDNMSHTPIIPNETAKIDGLVLERFISKFNEKYNTTLLAEQKELLTHYISSFVDNSLSLKVFLNDEIARLKEALQNSLNVAEIKEDPSMARKTQLVIEKLEGFYSHKLDEGALLTILKTQELVKEIKQNGD